MFLTINCIHSFIPAKTEPFNIVQLLTQSVAFVPRRSLQNIYMLMYSCMLSLSRAQSAKGSFRSFGVAVFFMVCDKDCCAVEDVICTVLVCHGVVHFISISPKSHLSMCCVTVWVRRVPLVFCSCRNLLQVILLARFNMFFMACVAMGFSKIKCVLMSLKQKLCG